MNDASGEASAESVGIGVIGARSYVANAAVMPAIEAAANAHIAATASLSQPVHDRWAASAVDSYEAVLAHPDVDAVYIPLPNGMHHEWTEKAARAGKHVLCEKPLAADASTAAQMVETCERAGVVLAEAYMTPFHRRYEHVLNMVREGRLGNIEKIDARFTFTIADDAADNYRWDPSQGGGALLDVGIYCLGPIVDMFGAYPERIEGGSVSTTRGVDASTHAVLTFSGPRHGSVECSFIDDEQQFLAFHGSTGRLVLDNQAFTGGDDDARVLIDSASSTTRSNDPYLRMIETFAGALLGTAEWPRPIRRSVEMLELIERIREATQ